MCGISGFSLAAADAGVDVDKLAKELLLGIEHRGKDATGAAYYKDGTLMIHKGALPAKRFIQQLEIPDDATNVILHTRLGTQGSERDNKNNHPVANGGVVGVHNGIIYNDDDLFKYMGVEERRIGEVDSEAIFAAIAYGTELGEDGKPRLAATVPEVLEQIKGSAAIAWQVVEGDTGLLHLARINYSPVHVARTENGSFVFASTKYTIEAALKKLNIKIAEVDEMEEGTYLQIRDGSIVQTVSFTPGETWGTSRRGFGGTTRYTSTAPHWSGYECGRDWTSPSLGTGTATAKTDTAKSAKGPFTPWLSADPLQKHLAFMLRSVGAGDEAVKPILGDAYFQEYRVREEAIEEYMKDLACDPDALIGLMNEIQAYARPGDWVYTDLVKEEVIGQIVSLPSTFPTGDYILRVMVPHTRYLGGFEPVLVSRTHNEFSKLGIRDLSDYTSGDDSSQDAEVDDAEDVSSVEAIINEELCMAGTDSVTILIDDEEDYA